MTFNQKDQQQRKKDTTSNRNVDFFDKVNILIETLENDLDACDFKWTLFVAAAMSYKYDSLLKPFPNAYVTNKLLNINNLRDTIRNIPALSVLLKKLRNCYDDLSNDDCINEENIDLLYWCLITVEPTLKSVHRLNVSKILEKRHVPKHLVKWKKTYQGIL